MGNVSISAKYLYRGVLSWNPRQVHCGFYFTPFLLPLTWRKIWFANTKTLLEKQKADMDGKPSCRQAELPNPSLTPNLCRPPLSSSVDITGTSMSWCSCFLRCPHASTPSALLLGSVLVSHLHTAVTTLPARAKMKYPSVLEELVT